MEPARATSTDERLDDFRRAVDERFDRVDERFNRVDERFNHVDERFNHVDIALSQLGTRIDAQTARIDAIQRTLLQVGGAQVVALLATLVALVTRGVVAGQ